jgi:hypothetical protein
MTYPTRVRVVEVGPRDGLQNEPSAVSVATKVALIEALADAGLTSIEAGSFVSPRWVPQMAETAEVLARLRRRPGVSYPVLVPNLQGLDRALACGVEEVAVFGAASEGFSRRNINCSIEESLGRFAPVVEKALAAGLGVRGYVSCVLGCPYEGEVPADAVAHVAAALLAMGCYEISLGDTIGTGTPLKARRLVDGWRPRCPRADRPALPRHLRPGAREHPRLPRAGCLGRGQRGRGPRRLPVRAGRHRQRRHRGRRLHARRHGHRDRPGRGAPVRRGRDDLVGAGPPDRVPRGEGARLGRRRTC